MPSAGEVVRFALRGAVGFGVGGLLMFLGLVLAVRSTPNNLSYLPRKEGESPLVGQWQAIRSAIRSARFEEDGTVVVLTSEGAHAIEGTYSMTNDWSAELRTTGPWKTAAVFADPAHPDQPELQLTHEDGTVAQLRWSRRYAPPPRRSTPIGTFVLAGVPFLCGAVGAGILTYGSGNAVRGATGFGCAAIPAAFVVVFTHISLQGGGRPDYAWAAIGCGIGFALAGAIGGLSIRPALLLPGAVCFGLAGAVWGPVSFWSIAHGAKVGGILGLLVGISILLIPFVVGGGLFGAAVGLLGAEE